MTVSEFDLARYLELRDEAGWVYGRLNELANEALEILQQHWPRVDALAEALLAKGPTFSGEEARALLARTTDLHADDEYSVTRRRNTAEIFASFDFERVAA